MRPQFRIFRLAQPLPPRSDNEIKLREGAAMIIQEMTPAECLELLQQTGIGRLACARSGQPYVVPIYFAVNKEHLYGFSTLGKKIEWMRANPLVCVEVDEIISPGQWRSVIVFGRYHELPDLPVYASIRHHAHSLLQKRASWWEPADVSSTHRGKPHSTRPIFYRISIDEITGHRAQPDTHDLATMSRPLRSSRPASWLARWISPGGPGRNAD
jgi:nitroimidazol reductase NimA-like FMN-containing flavoprotein (pyridoxamine 5'-phosphate oxidase superfamily)